MQENKQTNAKYTDLLMWFNGNEKVWYRHFTPAAFYKQDAAQDIEISNWPLQEQKQIEHIVFHHIVCFHFRGVTLITDDNMLHANLNMTVKVVLSSSCKQPLLGPNNVPLPRKNSQKTSLICSLSGRAV